MRILIVKTSSLGDVVHMLPALTDAARAIPGLTADWVVEEGFAAVPSWHPAVARILPIALRRWRKRLGEATAWRELAAARQALGQTTYDAVIDSQGLLKSALFARWARGPRWGYDQSSCREPLASLFYTHRVHVPRGLHAIERSRRLLAAALGYPLNDAAVDYGLSTLAERFPPSLPGLPERYVVALHGTSRIDKEWPEAYWIAVGLALAQHGLALLLPWGNPREHERAQR
ncbi:MAG: lipopolysaccharide heptosyltransferase I, partial [Gammaproteobacteria bacterium]|nr:lipopolysaccharide heptosyltransferase I [Gammaproteobacteria bacterium]